MFPRIFISLIITCFLNSLKSQNLSGFETIINDKISDQNVQVKPHYNGRFLRFYKKFISSQDGEGCGFYPSCSQYAVESINAKGFFIGTLAAFDRLSRCNGGNHQFYILHKNTEKILDLPK